MLVFAVMTSAIVFESCQGDRMQVQKSVLQIAKISVAVHSVWQSIYLRSCWDRRADAGCCVLLSAPALITTAKERGTYAAVHTYYNFSANEQNCEVRIRKKSTDRFTVNLSLFCTIFLVTHAFWTWNSTASIHCAEILTFSRSYFFL
jgi:hypothetical protein